MNIIDERDVRTIHRKLKKKEYDNIMTLSTNEGQTVRLLDEGMVVRSDGSPDFYIMKGTLQRFYDELDDDYEGSINLGHMDFATFPILLGKWSKKDLTLVDIGDGRMGLDVNLRLDDENLLVRELKRASYDLGVSAEFTYSRNEEATEEFGLLIIDGLRIWDFAIVGDAGNVNSMGIRLKGESMDIKEMMALLSKDDLASINNALDEALEEKELSVEPTEEVTEETEEEIELSAEEEVEEINLEVEEEEEKDEIELSEEEEEKDEIDLSTVMETLDKLSERIEKLENEKSELEAELSAKKKNEADFVEKFKKLSSALAESKETVVVETASFTDGFGG